MRIQSVYVRHFRSVNSTELTRCGGLNVLIGKNNAGKSNLLSAIEHGLDHLKRGAVAAPWAVRRPAEEFTDRDTSARIQIGLTFDLPAEINERLRTMLAQSFPNVAKSIEQIKDHPAISFIISAVMEKDSAFLYLEQMAIGTLSNSLSLSTEGMRLLTVGQEVASELNQRFRAASEYFKDIEYLDSLISDRRRLDRRFSPPKDEPNFLFYEAGLQRRVRPELVRQVEALYRPATTATEFVTALSPLMADIRSKANAEASRETVGNIETFSGAAKTPPEYVPWLMESFGSIPLMHFKEEKERLGRSEAESLLQLKTKRGGPRRMSAVQGIIHGLLGVQIDAFRDDEGAPAEMDVDQFLVDANGAGIREALRIVLDLELKSPALVLVEEPEVHLHPGLARVVANYLRQKSSEIQMFVTTHSTEFVDSVSFQNAYLISKNPDGKTICQLVEAEDEALRIPAEIGLKLSTVFMFDRLLFVEGPSDEAVLRILAQKMAVDLTQVNLGFVHMEGVRNFAHFAADATIDLLSRRQILMWFLADRDEMEDGDVKRMVARLKGRACLHVLPFRELENSLLNPDAVAAFICEKLKAAKKNTDSVTRDRVVTALQESIAELKPEVVRLRLEKRILAPIYLQSRRKSGTANEKIQSALDDLKERLSSIEQQRAEIEQSINECWERSCADIVPGNLVLAKVAAKFDVKFSKENGDSDKLASFMSADAIPKEIKNLLEEVIKPLVD